MYHQAQVCVPFAQLTHIPLSAPSTRVVFILGLADQGVLRISHSGHVFSFSPGWLLLTPPPVVPPRSQRPIRRLMFHDLAPLHHLGFGTAHAHDPLGLARGRHWRSLFFLVSLCRLSPTAHQEMRRSGSLRPAATRSGHPGSIKAVASAQRIHLGAAADRCATQAHAPGVTRPALHANAFPRASQTVLPPPNGLLTESGWLAPCRLRFTPRRLFPSSCFAETHRITNRSQKRPCFKGSFDSIYAHAGQSPIIRKKCSNERSKIKLEQCQ